LIRKYLVPSYVTAKPREAEALELLANILAGRTGRLHRKLVDESKVAAKILAAYLGRDLGPGTILLSLAQRNGTPEEIEAALDQVLEEIRTDGVTESELELAKETLTAMHNGDKENEAALADRYGWAAVTGRTIAAVEGWPSAIAQVTTEDIKIAANTYIDPRRSVTGWLLPEAEDQAVPAGVQDPRLAKAV
jgi:zinc protease